MSLLDSVRVQKLFGECAEIAEMIFFEYLTLDAHFSINLEDDVRCNIFKKFGC